MPTLANIVIKKADGTTDVTYTAIKGAAGDGVPAVFRNDNVGTTLAERPTLAVKSSSNKQNTLRRVRGDFAWPTVQTDSGGQKIVNGRTSGDFNFAAPQNQEFATIKEQAYQFGNLVASAIIKSAMAEGNAPTAT